MRLNCKVNKKNDTLCECRKYFKTFKAEQQNIKRCVFQNASEFFLLSVILEHALEALAGEEDTALDRAERKTHLVGDLIVFVTCDIHGEGHFVFARETVDCNGDFLGGV